MARLALFDLDNTLCDREAGFARWARLFCETHRLDTDDALPWLTAVDDRGNLPRHELFARARSRFGIADDVDRLYAAWQHDYPASYVLEPATADGLAKLRADGFVVAIVTNGDAVVQGAKLRVTGLHGRVHGVAISGAERVAKPAPEIFRRAAGRCGLTLESLDEPAWMVGDNPVADIGGAALTGLRSIWMRLGRTWAEPAFRPDFAVDAVTDAIAIIAAS